MRHLIFIFLLSLFTQTAFAQYQSGKVVYKVIPPKSMMAFKDTTKIKNVYSKNAFVTAYNRVKTHAPHMNLVMEFNTREALAQIPPRMDRSNNSDFYRATIRAKLNHIYYTDAEKDHQIHEFEVAGRNWLVLYERNNSLWKITDETKEILGYTCYKATSPLRINGIEVEEEIEAWFAPELPFQFGPSSIHGLPGLILEVKRRNFTYYASEIKLEKTDKKIKKLKGNPIPELEFHAEMKKMRDAFR